MNRSQDTFIDDDEETCPLCIEEFDLSDKNFRPCPCGYQICQFCFNSLKTTYEKSTCPNCRRPYDESTIQYKIPTAEEFKLDLMNKNKKQAAAKRKETEKREVESSSRRNLAGVRVKQQNLVYVIGLEPTKKDESVLLETLRGKEFFGQYGDIEKIVVSKAKPGATNQGIGVYVTFKRKEDAALCIDAVDGSINGERILRAQYGTTKYCSAFLRGETCMNKNCSFLHETGEDGHHTSLQNEPSDGRHSTRPPLHTHSSTISRVLSQGQLSHSSLPMARQGSKDTTDSRKGSQDGSALPPTAGWANANTPVARAGRTSQAASSPQLSNATPSIPKTELAKASGSTSSQSSKAGPKSTGKSISSASPKLDKSTPKRPEEFFDSVFEQIKKCLTSDSIAFNYDDSFLSAEERAKIADMPPLYDPYGGAKRRMMEEKEVAERTRMEFEDKEKLEAQAKSTAEEALEEDPMASGSLALGGEPEDNAGGMSGRGTISRPAQQLQPPLQSTAFEMSDFDRRGNQFSQAQYEQMTNHQRNGSRYFNNDSKAPRFQGAGQQSFYSSGVQGPPPGLPTAGTPPVSGGGMFAHGQGFANTGFGAAKDNNADLLRGRDVSKRGGVEHLADPSILQARVHQNAGTTGQSLFGGVQAHDGFPALPSRPIETHSRISSLQSFQGGRSSTPKVPPGFESVVRSEDDVIQSVRSNITVPVLPAIPSVPPASTTEVGEDNLQKIHPNEIPVSPAVPQLTEPEMPLKSVENPKRNEQNAEASVIKVRAESPESSVKKVDAETSRRNEQKVQSSATKVFVETPRRSEWKIDSSATNVRAESPQRIDQKVELSTKVSTEEKIALPSSHAATTTTDDSGTPSSAAASPAPDVTRRPRTIRLTTSMIKQNEPITSASPAKQDHSRQPSISSMSRSRPSTPAVSDHLLSRDVSRANSPPLGGIVGSAPARNKSKNQTKKDRKDKAKKVEPTESLTNIDPVPATPAEDVAPIVARQKKQKKKAAIIEEATKHKATAVDEPKNKKPAIIDEATKHKATIAEETTKVKSAIVDEATRPKAKDNSAERADPTSKSPIEEVEHPIPVSAVKKTVPRSSFTMRDLCNEAAQDGDDPGNIKKILTEHIPSMTRLISDLIASGDLPRDHPWLTNPSFNSPAYKLPPDSRKGQEYLDGNGYGGNDAFGYVYLPQKEKRALYAGHAVSVADTGDRKNDLLRRCLISPNGWVMRHLSADESERVLELEERRSLYIEEYGELGHMNGLDVLEEDDFINLGGGIEELGRYGSRHGVCWVMGDKTQDDEEVYDDLDDDELLAQDGMSEETDEDLGLDLTSSNNNTAWDSTFSTSTAGGFAVNLRAMDIDTLHTRIKEKHKEFDASRKEAEKAEKNLIRKSKEVSRWKDAILKA